MTEKKKTNRANIRQLICYIVLLIFGTIATIIVSQLVVGKLMILVLGADTFSETVPTAVFSALSYIVALLMLIWLPTAIKNARRKNKNEKPVKTMGREELGLKDLPTWTDIGLAPAGFIVYLVFAAALVALFSTIPGFDPEQAQEVGFDTHLAGVDRMIAFLVLVVIAPIAEEIIFRGWLYTKLKNRLSKETTRSVSIALTAFLVSLAFGIVHLQWNVGINVFAMSIVACALRELTGTIYAGILLHMLKNGIAFYMLFIAGIM